MIIEKCDLCEKELPRGEYVRAAKRMEKARLKPPLSNIKKLPTPLSNIHKQGVSLYPLICICCPVTRLKFL